MNSAPPKGDFEKAEKYINQLVSLIEQNKIEALHTDLQKFDPSSIQDHYRIDLKDYQIEISHSKLPNSGADSFVMLFTNLKNVESGESDKVILAYLQLSDQQFHKFKTAAQSQIQEKQRLIEEKRFKEALNPIDDLLAGAAQKNPFRPRTIGRNLPTTHSRIFTTSGINSKRDQPTSRRKNRRTFTPTRRTNFQQQRRRPFQLL